MNEKLKFEIFSSNSDAKLDINTNGNIVYTGR